jgi:lipopolysaccharide/colanic/teichoic acid biosynthesis glycosyltransferase
MMSPGQKRLFDLFSSVFALTIIIPVGVLLYPFLLCLIGKPIIFKQKRTGKDGKEFVMYKLRSMNKNAQSTKSKYLAKNEAPVPMFKIAEDPRFIKKKLQFLWSEEPIIIKIGKYLSQSGIDEIPQLFNVLKGEMSLVGPRPLPISEALELQKIDPAWSKWRSSVRPGIFSAWALDPEHNKSFEYWKKLEKKGLNLTLFEQIRLIKRIIFHQLQHLLNKLI